jgi:small GTP-binding protein
MAGLNETPKGERLHIAFFGKRNAGKSSLINAFSVQELSIVSDTKGTTTDPVLKAMELLPLGPVMIIDTPGIDDEGELGSLRVQKAMQVIRKTDVMVIVTHCTHHLAETEPQLISLAPP